MADAPPEPAKLAAARAALALVEDGMTLGLGTGSTAAIFVDLLAERMLSEGLGLAGVPTSARTAGQAAALGIPLTTLDAAGVLDLTIDGADEVDPACDLIKGGGGALLREKIVASASRRMVVIADESKLVPRLGRFPLPVEVVRFGLAATERAIGEVLAAHGLAGRTIALRGGAETPFLTDEGHLILDLALGAIADAAGLNRDLNVVPGVVETGLFPGMAAAVVIGRADGTSETRTGRDPGP